MFILKLDKKFSKDMRLVLGFSLLELMVVVAIIGVLATFAVPRFNIFRARARQGEARSNLGVIFTLQEAFKIDKEEYYNGVGGTTGWGGNNMSNSSANNHVGYTGNGTGTTATCGTNKLGFRLANCDAARYMYYIVGANEDEFLSVAYAKSDTTVKRIFPGCDGSGAAKKVSESSSKTAAQCDDTYDATSSVPGGDGFCLDQSRQVDNFRDIVEFCDD